VGTLVPNHSDRIQDHKSRTSEQSAHAVAIRRELQSIARWRRKGQNMWWKWILALIPPVACLGLVTVPAVNGPRLWLGLPSLLWWTAVFGVVLVTAVLGVFEIVGEQQEPGEE
jgi:hypothetical protein